MISPSTSHKRKAASSRIQLSSTPSKVTRTLYSNEASANNADPPNEHAKRSLVYEEAHGGEESEKLNQSFELFDDSNDDFDDFLSSLPDSVMNGSQPLPGRFKASELPDHVLENIFSCLPIRDMLLSCTLVCHRWKNIIMDEKFMLWKKFYHKVRENDQEAISHIEGLLKSTDLLMENTDNDPLVAYRIGNIIRFARETCPLGMFDSNLMEGVCGSLKKHPLYKLSHDLVTNRIFTSDFNLKNDCDVWVICTTILLLSPNVFHMQSLKNKLCSFKPLPHVMDFFYMLSLLMWMLHRHQLISQEYHYKLYCTISLLENTSTPLPLCQSSESCNFNLTHEQRRVVGHEFKPGQLVRVMAYAGAGKTSTLIACVNANPQKRFLYTSFSKAVVDLGKEVFSKHQNVHCATLHSLAYRALGMNRYRYKMSRGTLRARDIREKLNMDDSEAADSVLVVKTVVKFMASDSNGLKLCHVPNQRKVKDGGKWVWKEVDEDDKKSALSRAKKYWKHTSNLLDKNWPMTDDCYLKKWQLSRPDIFSYDVIMLDEAQDCSECMRDILERQRIHTALVFVGDSHQQIYGFRRARDALLHVSPSHSFYLTQSFRFGGEIAQVADLILRAFKFNGFLPPGDNKNRLPAISDKTLLGVGPWGTVSGNAKGAQHALLCRTNRRVIEKTLSCLANAGMQKKVVAMVGGAEKLGLNLLHDIYVLAKSPSERSKNGLFISSRFIRRFQNLRKLIDEAELNEDQELLSKIDIVKSLGDKLPEAIEKLKALPSNYATADVVLSTVHKAKGLEFDTVTLASDFSEELIRSIQVKGFLHPSLKEEANLLYVAATRAKRVLEMSPVLAQLLRYSHVRFLRATPTSKHFGDATNGLVTCAECKKPLNDKPVMVFEQNTIRHMQSAGPLCSPCANVLAPGWGNLLGDPEDIRASDAQEMFQAHERQINPPV
uniref:DNA 3'-5' helicase n=1 Tax=Phallusia mammillata TaxID=59560 RepID=A0A6F9DC39_9ASCI|nr:F-box only protein 18 [Phallusia mammillata]